jgi:hypothetical protein
VNEGKIGTKISISPVDLYVKRIVVEDAIFLSCLSLEKQKNMGIGENYYSFKKVLDSESEEIQEMNIVENMLKLFHSQCGVRSKEVLTSSQFIKLANL